MKYGSFKIAAIYVCSSILWIAFSDKLISSSLLKLQPWLITDLSIFKGSFFVSVTGFILYKLINYNTKFLQQSERRYRGYFEDNPNPMWVFNRDTLQFVHVNEATVVNYGYSHQEFQAMTILDIQKPYNRDKIKTDITKIRDHYKNSGTWPHIRKDGSTIFVEITSHLLTADGQGNILVLAKDVTAQHIAEQQLLETNTLLINANTALDEQKQLLAEVQHLSKLGGWEYHIESGKMVRSDEIFKLFDFTSADEKNPVENLISHIHPDDRDTFINSKISLESGNGSTDIIFRVNNDNGQLKYIRQLAHTENRDGKPYILKGSIQDITEIKRLEAERNDFQLKLEYTLDSVSDAFFTLDMDWYIQSANSMFEKLTSIKRDQVLNHTFMELRPESIGSGFHKSLKKVIEERQTVKFEDYSPALKKWLRFVCYPTKEGAAIYFTDITESKKKDDLLKMALERYDLAARATGEMLYDFDFINNKTSYSQSYGALPALNLTGEDDASNKWLNLVQPDDLQHVKQTLELALENKNPKYNIEYRVDYGDNQYHFVLDQGHIIYSEAGTPMRMIGAVRNISDLKAKEFSLSKQNDILKEIAWTESHEIRRPVASIMGLVDLLKHCQTDAEKKEIIDYIDVSAGELDYIIRRINHNITDLAV